MNPITVFLVVALVVAGAALEPVAGPAGPAAGLVAAAVVSLSLKMAQAWQRFVILRAGSFMGVRGPGLFWIIPILDQVTQVIDQRIQTTAFNAEQALTRDTVPVNVDAIMFWRVHDAEKAALEITDFRQAIDRVAQTSLRETIGGSMLTPAALRAARRRRAAPRTRSPRKTVSWGVEVMSVEIRDVAIPGRPAGRHVAARPRPSGRSRRGSSSARPKPRWRPSSSRRRAPTPTSRWPSSCAP